MDAKVISWCGVGVCFYSWGPIKCSLEKKKAAHKERTPSSGHCLKFPRNEKGRPNVSPPQDWPQRGGRGRSPANFYQQKSTHLHAQGRFGSHLVTLQRVPPSQSRRTLSQFGSAGSEGSSNELKHSKPNLMEMTTPAGPATRVGSSLPDAPLPHLCRPRGRLS